MENREKQAFIEYAFNQLRTRGIVKTYQDYHYICTYLSTKLIKYVNKQVIKGINFGFGGQ